MNEQFGIIGGDLRSAELARLLEADGYTTACHGIRGAGLAASLTQPETDLDRAAAADTVILPLPLCAPDGTLNAAGKPLPIEDLFARIRPGTPVLAGLVPETAEAAARRYGLRLTDYFRRESMTVANAAATADAAVMLAAERMRASLSGRRCLVLGFGRIGKLLCLRLRGLCAEVSAAARRPEDRAWIRAFGCRALDIGNLSGALADADAVFNTVPAPVLDRPLLARLPRTCLLIDLASRPGIDPEAARALGMDPVWARSLPGKRVPRTAAAILRDTVYEILKGEILKEERGGDM